MADLERYVDGDVWRLILHRPQRRNALGDELVAALVRELAAFEADASAAAAVLEGAAPGFCAGSDLKELAELDVPAICAHEAQCASAVRRIALLRKPVVAAVEGFAIGGGFMLAIACDIVVTTDDARWQLPEVSMGWIPPWGLELLSARVGPVRARRLVYGADSIDGREAFRLGIADELARTREAGALAGAAARRLGALPRAAVASTKRFFAPLFGGGAEASDAEANALFRADCGEEAARATLRRMRAGRTEATS